MEPQSTRSISLLNKTYNDVVRILNAIGTKSEINVLKIFQTVILEFKTEIFNGFNNLIDLDLSNCSICILEGNVFENTPHLKFLNLSFNLINSIDTNLFKMNSKLHTLNLKNNFFDDINTTTYSALNFLEILDLSHNYISVLNANCLNCQNLKKLYLNYNRIGNMASTAFHQLPKLTSLRLDNNRVNKLENAIFEKLINLEYLNLSHNLIEATYYTLFWNLKELKSVHLSNNLISHTFDKFLFIYNIKLVEVDLSENNYSLMNVNSFHRCYNIRSLKVQVCGYFEISMIKYLPSLVQFQLFYKPAQQFFLNVHFWRYLQQKVQLTILKLIFQEIDVIHLCVFSYLVNLEYLHIECKKPNNHNSYFLRFKKNFDRMPKLRQLTLKNLNNCTIWSFDFTYNNLKYLDLTGIKNSQFTHSFYTFEPLEHLNLSFSELCNIEENVFKYLVNLRYLDIGHTKITSIQSMSFYYNSQLRFLICSYCLINTIEELSFRTLDKLKVLDLHHNYLENISENTFFGLRRDSCVIIM